MPADSLMAREEVLAAPASPGLFQRFVSRLDRAAPRRVAAGLFFFLFAVFYLSPNRTSFDSRWSIHTSLSVWRGNAGALDEFAPIINTFNGMSIETVDDRPRNVYPMGVSLLALPFVALTDLVNPKFMDVARHALPEDLEALVSSFYGALACIAFFFVGRRMTGRTSLALGGSLLLAFATPMWSNATRALWQHAPLMLMLTAALLCFLKAKERPLFLSLAGAALAFGYVIRPTAALPILLFSAYVLWTHRWRAVPFFIGLLAVALPWLLFNARVYGQWLPSYYKMGMGATNVGWREAAAGLLVSPGRGLLVYSPVFLFSFIGMGISFKDREWRWLNVCAAAAVIGHWVSFWSFVEWWGGHCYGPRLMSDIVPFLCYFLLYFLREAGRWRRAAVGLFGVLTLVSVGLQALGAVSWAGYDWNARPTNVDHHTERLWDWRDPPFARNPLQFRPHRYRASRFYR